jgi:hypothetical protein
MQMDNAHMSSHCLRTGGRQYVPRKMDAFGLDSASCSFTSCGHACLCLAEGLVLVTESTSSARRNASNRERLDFMLAGSQHALVGSQKYSNAQFGQDGLQSNWCPSELTVWRRASNCVRDPVGLSCLPAPLPFSAIFHHIAPTISDSLPGVSHARSNSTQ